MIANGSEISNKILKDLKAEIKRQTLKPRLAVVLLGNDPASQTYIRKKQEAAESIGVGFLLYKFPEKISTEALIAEIKQIQTQDLSGIIVQPPLPAHLDRRKVLNVLNPEIDVDYLSWESLGKLVIGENSLVP